MLLTPDEGVLSVQNAVLEKGNKCKLFLEHDSGKTLLCSLNSEGSNPVEQFTLNLAVSSDEQIFVFTNSSNARVHLNGYIVVDDSPSMTFDQEIDYDEAPVNETGNYRK